MKTRRKQIGGPAELAAWSSPFHCGYDYFEDLPHLDDLDRVTFTAAAKDAWARVGRAYLESDYAQHGGCWALKQFGVPT